MKLAVGKGRGTDYQLLRNGEGVRIEKRDLMAPIYVEKPREGDWGTPEVTSRMGAINSKRKKEQIKS